MLSSIIRRIRWLGINLRRGLYVSHKAFIAKTACLQLESDGFTRRGGTIHISSGARISDGAILAAYGGSIHLAENVYVGPYCVLYGHGGLTIGRNTLIANHTTIVPSNHIFSDSARPIRSQGETRVGITIGEDVWIGSGVKILDGVIIGDGCVVGAGSILNRSLEPYSVVAGSPAKLLRMRGESSVTHRTIIEDRVGLTLKMGSQTGAMLGDARAPSISAHLSPRRGVISSDFQEGGALTP
jgi:acetyltransferase-like isoleucine patch superfamily enzyme